MKKIRENRAAKARKAEREARAERRKNRRPLRLSASSAGNFEDCPRKWWYERIDGRTLPSSPKAALGTRCHTVAEGFIAKGKLKRPESREAEILLAGRRYLRKLRNLHHHPKVETFIELGFDLPAGMLGPLPVKGFADFVAWDSTGRYMPKQALIVDHKTTGNIHASYHPTDETLAGNFQMGLYAWALFGDKPRDVHVRHIRYATEGRPEAMEINAVATPQRQIEIRDRATHINYEMHRLSKIDDPAEVPANASACGKYGGCPYQGICDVASSKLFPFQRRSRK